jgi:hypothetical protein
LVLSLLLSLGACGRVGVHLIPQSDAHPRDSGASPDAGRSPEAGTNTDGGTSAEGGIASDGGSLGDGGPGTDGGMSTDGGPSDASMVADGGGVGGGGPDSGALMSCPVTCENTHGTADCTSGSCALSCAIGYSDCDTATANGCEQSTTDSVASCGMCGRTCVNAHGTAACTQGLCSPTCAAGYADCDTNAANGCETDVGQATDCGSCGHACANMHGTTQCASGVCTPTCDPGYGDCDGNPDNGCEADLQADPNRCGMCTRVCNAASEFCMNGTCQPSPCSPGFGECDGNPAVNCETDLTTSVGNCGFCGNACTLAHATPNCVSSTCGIASCASGYADCDTTASNGCEIPLATTTNHCGNCATACTNAHGTTSCAASVCVPSCSAGYGDCDSSRPNGCETQLNTISNCGMCGKVCPANGGTPQCTSGVCTTVCDLNGVWAMKMTVAVTWAQNGALAAGSGTFTWWARVSYTQSGTSLSGTLASCGVVVPDFGATVGEKYGLVYPNTLFDRMPFLPSTNTSATLGGTGPGSSFTSARSAIVLGATLSDPLGAWPSVSAIVPQDGDADGKVAVSGDYKTSSGYSAIPTNLFASQRANRGYIGSRTILTPTGTLTSCTQISGNASSEGVDSHTIGCRLTTGTDCSTTQRNYLDSSAPIYQAGASSFTMVKVASNAACSDIRAAVP